MRVGPLRESLIVFAGVATGTWLLTRLVAIPALREHVPLLVGMLFLLTALSLARREAEGVERFGIDLGGLLSPPDPTQPAGPLGLLDLGRTLRRALPSALRETAIALVVALLVFVPYGIGFWLWNRPLASFEWNPPNDLVGFAAAQLIVIALPEEALFRGYFQTRLTDAWPRTQRLLGARISLPALVVQALLFGALHFLVDLAPVRMIVFFPGLLFGWLRAARGGIGAAVVLHAASNLYSDLLVRGFS